MIVSILAISVLRDDVHVNRTVGVGRNDAPSVEQDECAVGAEAAKVDRRLSAARRERLGGPRRWLELRQLVERLLDRGHARARELRLADRQDRAFGSIVLARNARAGDDDVGPRPRGRTLSFGRVRLACPRRFGARPARLLGRRAGRERLAKSRARRSAQQHGRNGGTAGQRRDRLHGFPFSHFTCRMPAALMA